MGVLLCEERRVFSWEKPHERNKPIRDKQIPLTPLCQRKKKKEKYWSINYKVAKTHRMPQVVGHFPQKSHQL